MEAPARRKKKMPSIKLVSLYVGIAFGIFFLGFTGVKYRKFPEFVEIAAIILSCIGAVIGIDLGYVVLTVDDGGLGKLAEYRVQITLGAFAVIWTAINSIVKTCQQAIKSIIDKS